MMTAAAIARASRVQHTARRRIESDPLADPREQRERSAAHRSLREIRRGDLSRRPVGPLAQSARETPEPGHAVVGAALVEHEQVTHGGMIREQPRGHWRHHYIHGPPRRQFREARRRQDDITEIARLDYE